MLDFKNIQVKELYDVLWSINRYGKVGWSFSPISYKDKQFVVEWRISVPSYLNKDSSVDDVKVIAFCYEYAEKRRLFRGHKGNFVFETEITVVELNGRTVDLRRTREPEMMAVLPQIMKEVFQAYAEREKNESAIKQRLETVMAWDGKIT